MRFVVNIWNVGNRWERTVARSLIVGLVWAIGGLSLGAQEGKTTEGKQIGELIFLRDYGTDDIAYLVVPEQQPLAGVVVLPDKEGVTERTKKFCDALGKKGYLVLCLDIYNGRTAKNEAEAAQLADSLKKTLVEKTLATGLKFFESSPRFQMEQVFVLSLGVTAEVTVESMARQKNVAGLILMNPQNFPDKEKLDDLRMGLQVLLTQEAGTFSDFKSLDLEFSEASRKLWELRILENGTKPEAYLDSVHAFINRVLVEPRREGLIEKIF
ncbi:MAG: hypothetical protein HC904_05640 [Blastochloris sp.]|nr:hypothetical protein [Blastochloris sp.]